MKYLILLALAVILLPVRVLAYTSPGNPTGYVNDFAGILSPPTKAELETNLSSLEASTSAQVAVVTINSLNGDTIENYAVKLFEEWKIGQKNKDNGVLLLVAVEERKVRIEVGYGLEPTLTDAQTAAIIRNIITPRFKQEAYDQGVSEAVGAIATIIRGESPPAEASPTPATPAVQTWLGIFIGLLPVLLWFLSVMARSKSWWLGGVVGAITGVILLGLTGLLIFGVIGLLLDYIVSRGYKQSRVTNQYPWWIGGRNGFGGFGGSGGGSHSSGGGFGGFGGGRSGGGGASGGW